ncbi:MULTISPECIES: UDP-glucose dehydrogenase family protein [Metabacillus]|jgi:UDPglucose 6-dehydrogenase|uniref:UDP-glucose 6-dehydrogenase n=1 Tax=Metabacillus rhizolycopersici TaxID=2875709 RepID=A0ABS7UWM2_9BACI|nr:MULTISPECIES: UDP-glucose/GDP-mannose dehydrogenase family protein [Metabacillus]MBZ5752723.1 UDP-glucose/GDP-mannose dehydrogenase family protein [Metabacillus rhizolycopersici]MCM3652573.1 UDP-glucose/GDP-mannose dehydrogenase family protein [Metabacillus litoralis]
MKICIVGAGYVGLTSASVLADLGHTVCCVDTNKEKIKSLNLGEVPIYEPGIKELISKNKDNLTFSSNVVNTISKYPVILIAVGTPSLPDGKTDLTYIHSVVDLIAETLTSYKTIITKSTVPPGTNEEIHNRLIQKGIAPELFSVVSNPEFLREGSAIFDMMNADKIVVGMKKNDKKSLPIMKSIYQGLEAPYIMTSLSGAEMIKYTSNAFLATKISFINEIARICDKYEVNIEDVVRGISTDPRISPHFLQSGLGYGGSCFPKDVRSLEHSALEKNITPLILQAIQATNHTQVDFYIDKLSSAFDNLPGKTISVLGIAFKPNTDDTRCSRAVQLIDKLSQLGCKVNTYDPKATLPFIGKANIIQYTTLEQSVTDTDCIIIATEWDEFRQLDWKKIKELMKGNVVLDARNCIDPSSIYELGLDYIGVARS